MGLFRRAPDLHDHQMEVEQIRAEVAALREALDHRDAQLATLDARVTSVSTELANQLTELGHELDGLDGLHRVDELHEGAGAPGQGAGPLPARLPRGPRPAGRDRPARPADPRRQPPTAAEGSSRLRAWSMRSPASSTLAWYSARLPAVRASLASCSSSSARRQQLGGIVRRRVGRRRLVVRGLGPDAVAEVAVEPGEQLAERLAERLAELGPAVVGGDHEPVLGDRRLAVRALRHGGVERSDVDQPAAHRDQLEVAVAHAVAAARLQRDLLAIDGSESIWLATVRGPSGRSPVTTYAVRRP